MIYIEEIVERLIIHWQKKNSTSEIVFKDDVGNILIDTNKAKVHLKTIILYDIIGNQLPLVEAKVREIKKPTLTSISKVVNDKHQKDYDERIAQQVSIQNRIDIFNNSCQEIICELEFELNLQELKKDFWGDRIFVKHQMGKLFNQYGIYLDNEMLEAIFGRQKKIINEGIAYKEQTVFIDNIELASKGKRFGKSLPYQFASTVNAEANGIFSAFFMRAAGQLKPGSNQRNNDNFECPHSLNNPLYAEQSTLKVLAECIAPIIIYRMNNIEEYKKKKANRENMVKVFSNIKH